MTRILKSIRSRKSKRLGRGVGSGKGGHTAGRGTKGQKARTSVGILFEGVKTKKSLLHRLPILRGKGKFLAKSKPYALDIKALSSHPAGEVTVKTLLENKIVRPRDTKSGVKIVGKGTLNKAFMVKLPVTGGAKETIVAAGGSIV